MSIEETSAHYTVYPTQATHARWEAMSKTGRHLPNRDLLGSQICVCNARPYQICSLKVLETKQSRQELPDCGEGAAETEISE